MNDRSPPPQRPQAGATAAYHFDHDILYDLEKSGLTPADLRARPITGAERAAANCSIRVRGYVIPYFSYTGEPLQFYRVKIVNPEMEEGIKYKQPKGSVNHIYFPPGFRECLTSFVSRNPTLKVVVITEGEKKACACVRKGIPAVALGGVDSWKTRTIILSPDTEISRSAHGKGKIRAKLPAGDVSLPEMQTLATGFGDLVDAIQQFGLTIAIVYDSDLEGSVKSAVQRSAALLGYELRYLGIPTYRIKQVILPQIPDKDRWRPKGSEDDIISLEESSKTALDDYLLSYGGLGLAKLLRKVIDDPHAFPHHPNPKGFINVQLERAGSRREQLQIASVVVSELDARGMRLRDPFTGMPYYYDGVTHKLMRAQLVSKASPVMHETLFGTFLYQQFGLTGNDSKVLIWLASQFMGEPPIQDVSPKRVLALISEKEDFRNPDGIAWQANDSQYFAVSPDPRQPIELCDNGAKSLLFEQDQVDPLDIDEVVRTFDELNGMKMITPWWRETLESSNLGKNLANVGASEGESNEAHHSKAMQDYATLLFYVSPFLHRWRGTQLPVELMIGEAGSGKSSLYALRLSVLCGRPALRNMPTDIKDWQASVSNAGGLHVIDNVHFADKALQQKMSDEICRLITEPRPMIEQRRYYTNNEQIRMHVDATFAMTAIEMPFVNSDIIQRAAVFHASAGARPQSDWIETQLQDRGGREAWVAHHLVFLHRFLKMAALPAKAGGWDTEFSTMHRLAHLEQCLKIAGRVLGMSTTFLDRTLTRLQTESLTEADWVLSGIRQFCVEGTSAAPAGVIRFDVGDIADWAQSSPEYHDNPILINSRKLGKYFVSHLATLTRVCNIQPIGMQANRMVYKAIIARAPQKTTK